MVMRPLCDTNMINRIYCEQINPQNLSDKVFGTIIKKSNLSIFACSPVYASMLHPESTTFEIIDPREKDLEENVVIQLNNRTSF